MKPRMRSAFLMLFVTSATLWVCVAPAAAVTAQVQELDPESIAVRSLSVAEAMKTSGYCYTGVSKALSPLGVTLTGSAAYQAREQLLADSRFMPVATDDSTNLCRGDIIVFNKSESHPYGHICVYQGNGEESSDHVSHLTSPDAYGGVTVFRFRSDQNEIASQSRSEWIYKMPVTAPDFHSANTYRDDSKAMQTSSERFGRGDTKSGSSLKSTSEFVRRQFRNLNRSVTGKSLTKGLVRFVLKNL